MFELTVYMLFAYISTLFYYFCDSNVYGYESEQREEIEKGHFI